MALNSCLHYIPYQNILLVIFINDKLAGNSLEAFTKSSGFPTLIFRAFSCDPSLGPTFISIPTSGFISVPNN